MPHAVTIANVGQAFAVLKEMQAEGLVWGDDHRSLGRTVLARLIEEQMAAAIERHLEQMAELDEADRRNGSYSRHLLTALGEIELCVPRTRRFSAGAVLRAYARRAVEIDRMILACFVLGLSTRKVGEALLPLLGQRISASTVSAVAKVLDAAVAGFHARPLRGRYRQLMLDGVVLARRLVQVPSAAQCWWRWASGPTARRRSSISISPAARVLPNGKPSSLACSTAASPARTWK
jgi:transposase-like protein